MTRPARHKLDVYGIELALATDAPQWATLARQLTFLDAETPEDAGQSTFAVWQPDTGPVTPHLVIWVAANSHVSLAGLVDTLAHEASHGAGQILQWIGHEVEGTDEPHAYLVGWLTRWLFDNIDRTSLA